MPPSISENNGLALITNKDCLIYSVGISTGGVAEMRMAELNPNRQILATTLDSEGAKFTRSLIGEKGLSKQISVKIEDISLPLCYENKFFDFIYARLVLHYLSKLQLANTLKELYRVLKNGGKFFVVVRSLKCDEANAPNATYDPDTGLTTYISKEGSAYSRYFHSENSITQYLTDAGFSITKIQSYKEQLYVDYMRTQLATQLDCLIEIVASK